MRLTTAPEGARAEEQAASHPEFEPPGSDPRGDKKVKGARLARRTVRWGYLEEKWWQTPAGLVAGNGVPVPAEALVELATLRGPPGRTITLPLGCSSMSDRHAQQPRRARRACTARCRRRWATRAGSGAECC